MKNRILITIFSITFITAIVFYFDISLRNSSYSTPDEALINLESSPYKISEIIETLYTQEKEYAYIFFYTQLEESKDYFAHAEFEKGK